MSLHSMAAWKETKAKQLDGSKCGRMDVYVYEYVCMLRVRMESQYTRQIY